MPGARRGVDSLREILPPPKHLCHLILSKKSGKRDRRRLKTHTAKRLPAKVLISLPIDRRQILCSNRASPPERRRNTPPYARHSEPRHFLHHQNEYPRPERALRLSRRMELNRLNMNRPREVSSSRPLL